MRKLNNYQKPNFRAKYKPEGLFMLLPALILMAVVLLGTLLLTIDFEIWILELERPYLIPWVLATGLVIAAPSMYLLYRKEFDLAHPLIFATITYFFPIFFLGGWSLVFGLSNYYYLNYVNDPEYNFPLTFVYVMLGFGGLSLGFFIPHGKKIGNYLAKWLPTWEFKPIEIVVPSVFFLCVGILISLLALELGQIGYQRAGVVFDVAGSLYYYLTLIIPSSTFLLWLAFFKFERWNSHHIFIAAAQILIAVFMLILLGGRSSLLYSFLLMVFAFAMAGRKFRLKYIILSSFVLPIFVLLGMIYGTTFRSLKTSDERVSIEQYGTVAVETMANITEKSWSNQTMESLEVLAERLEIVSSLGVVVANYERSKSYEASYGLENNIWTYTWTAFIPRILWKDKPLIADAYSYNELYFDHGGYGLAITAMGDLLRNFGPVGVPLGMMVLGFSIRIFYAMFIEGLPFSMWKSTIYLTVLTKISYDSFYGEIFPTVIRVAIVIFVQLFILKIVIYALRRNGRIKI
ncbi:MAG: oligosaccharide repeat unit polymerase [Acidobacteriota bacterium]|nr:oligosaccharide repeat unit polymerase [Acidobacteriota bacterium]